jgi:DNA polymerase elongation subunit (family B)
MYQNICFQKHKNLITVWDDEKGVIQFPYKKYAYKRNSTGKFVALDGTRVDKVYTWDQPDLDRNLIYESDLRPETRTLIDMYYETDDVSINHREMFLDIEVSTEGGFADPHDPWQPITSIAFYESSTKKSVVVILDTEGKLNSYKTDDMILESVNNEKDLLTTFLHHYVSVMPTIITGWNIDFFDIPYLYNRLSRVLGKEYANTLSPINDVVQVNQTGRHQIFGVSCLDYMALYKLFSPNEEVSYSLDVISKKELGRGKIAYEGSLNQLYQNDIEKFIEYNLMDVLLVRDLDDKLKFLSLARGICHKGHVAYEDIYFTTRYLDGACIVYMKRLGIVSPNRPKRKIQTDDEESEEDGFIGAYVKDPVPGLYLWTFDEDMKALYPSVMRTLNMSPETKLGKVSNWDDVKEAFWNDQPSDLIVKIDSNGHQSTIPLNDFRNYLIDNKYSISIIGVIYNLSKRGLIPSILEDWTEEREHFRALAKKAGKDGDQEQSLFFDLRQQVAKKMNNSLYGALGAPGFRFFDLDNAESTTICGQAVTKHAISRVNQWFFQNTKVEKDYVIYADTDSSFMSAMPIIEMMERKLNRILNDEERAKLTYKTSQVIETYINDSWVDFSRRYLCCDKNYFEIKQEYVASAGLWIARKRYAQLIISEKGVTIYDITKGEQNSKLDVKGMDVIRSDFPKLFRESVSDILITVLTNPDKSVIDDKIVTMRESMKTCPLTDIMFPTGIKNLEKYTVKKSKGQHFVEPPKGTPIHAKSALNYNNLIDYYKLNSMKITSGEKIKWTYLKTNEFGMRSVACRGFEDPEVIIDLIRKYVDYDQIFESSLNNKLNDIYAALNWGIIPKNTNINEFFSF